MRGLSDYIPDGTLEPVLAYLDKNRVHLTITRERVSVLGDYRPAVPGKNHRISVNGNLNRYAFLITLLHELAHLLTHEVYGSRVAAHGREWKQKFSGLLMEFMTAAVFPEDIREALQASLHNPAASSCADDRLMRILRRYDVRRNEFQLLEDLSEGCCFMIRGGRTFRKGMVLRKRIKCEEIGTGRQYLFSPVYEVKPVVGPLQ